MNLLPKYQRKSFQQLLRLIPPEWKSQPSEFDNIFSDEFQDCIAISGDLAGTHKVHWRWKKKSICDGVFRPKLTNQIALLLKIASNVSVPIYPRGGGTSYYGASTSSMGGIAIDLKQMNNFQIKWNECEVNSPSLEVQAGCTFKKVIDALENQEFALPSYPSSGIAATFGGWFNMGGSHGISTYSHGSLLKYIQKIEFVTAQGEVQYIENLEQIGEIFGTYGTLGIVTRLWIQLIPSKKVFLHTFEVNTNITNLPKHLKQIVNLSASDLDYVRVFSTNYEGIGDKNYETPVSFYIISPNSTFEFEEAKKSYSREFKSTDLTLFQQEIKFKQRISVLFLQQLRIHLSKLSELLEFISQQTYRYKIQYKYDLTLNADGWLRLNFMIPANTTDWIQFLSTKGIGHRIVKKTYKLGGKVYAYGLQNTLYFLYYERDAWKNYIQIKKQLDPAFILNPLKLTTSLTKLRRVDFLFALNLLWLRFKLYFQFRNKKQSQLPINATILQN